MPQLENGYTRIANEILEKLASTKLNGTQRRILDVVFRSTYGYDKKTYSLSDNYLAKATGIDSTRINKELNKLIKANIIQVHFQGDRNTARDIGFNKYHKTWRLGTDEKNSTDEKRSTDEKNNEGTDEKNNDVLTNPPVKTDKQQKIKQINDFQSIFDYYLTLDLIKHRAYTNDIAKAIKKAISDNKYDIEYCKTLLERHKRVVELSKKTKYPVKKRGIAEFFGQKAYQATHLICSEYEEGGKQYEQYLKPKLVPENKLKFRFVDEY